ncbi:MAG: HAD-IB family hydrolase [Mycolicibacterium sp.]|jgi:HAD superfamily hydrolase (TIGR01490 family)|nr:HAD-IB family hydrolase [Mycolicibacterium sp.]
MHDPIAAIATAPPGAHIGAFFDMDGTLVDGFTPAAHARHRIRNRQARFGEFVGIAEAALRYRFGRMQFDSLLTRAAGFLRGTELRELESVCEELFHSDIRHKVFDDMVTAIRAHQQAGHTVVLSSSALTIHAAPVARAFGIEHLICNSFELDGRGRLTGAIQAPIIWGDVKAAAAVAFSHRNGIDLSRSYFYGDGEEELTLMHKVGNPRPVNPRRALATAAAQHGWPTLRPSRTTVSRSL